MTLSSENLTTLSAEFFVEMNAPSKALPPEKLFTANSPGTNASGFGCLFS